MGPYAEVDSNLTLFPLQSRLNTCTVQWANLCQSRPWLYARLDFIPQSGTKNLASVELRGDGEPHSVQHSLVKCNAHIYKVTHRFLLYLQCTVTISSFFLSLPISSLLVFLFRKLVLGIATGKNRSTWQPRLGSEKGRFSVAVPSWHLHCKKRFPILCRMPRCH